MKIFLALTFLFLTSSLYSQNKLDIDFKTGDDNLQVMDHQENPEVRIVIRNKPDIIVKNINNGQEWPNNSIKRVTVALPDNISATDIKELYVSRKPIANRKYVWDYLKKDNWTLKSLTVTATINENGQNKRYELFNYYTRGNVFRFIYEGGNNIAQGTSYRAELKPPATSQENTSSSSNLVISAVFGTGGDNLEGGGSNNINLIIRFKNMQRPVSVTNLNRGSKWENFTVKTINNKEIAGTAAYTIDEIEKVELRHTGGGGMFADNWNLDKFKLTITKGTQSKVLVDEVASPIHRFTGDSRTKVFVVE